MTKKEIKELYTAVGKFYNIPAPIVENREQFIENWCSPLLEIEMSVEKILGICKREFNYFPYPAAILKALPKNATSFKHTPWELEQIRIQQENYRSKPNVR